MAAALHAEEEEPHGVAAAAQENIPEGKLSDGSTVGPKAVKYLRKAVSFMQARPGEFDEEYITSLMAQTVELELEP